MPASSRTAETADFDLLHRPGGFPWGDAAGPRPERLADELSVARQARA